VYSSKEIQNLIWLWEFEAMFTGYNSPRALKMQADIEEKAQKLKQLKELKK